MLSFVGLVTDVIQNSRRFYHPLIFFSSMSGDWPLRKNK
jgi:hypothetical protein